jgi:TonB-dependent receptor
VLVFGNRFARAIGFVVAALVSASAPVSAQTGTIRGTVVASDGDDALPSATVVVEATGLSALTDAEGRFAIGRVPAGSYVVQVTYVGYRTARIDVEVTAGQSTVVRATLATRPIELDSLVVYGDATRGQAKALQQQKTSPTITNVVSEDLFGRFPDRNAAETVRRLPGISVSHDQGEAEYVQIRGIDQEFNSLTVNGVRIPAPDGDDGIRSVGLDMINNNLLGEIEVVKALTPDMDADAVGGVINFGLRRAPSGGVGRVAVGAGLNDQTSDFDTYGRDITDASIVLGDRFAEDRLGLLADGAYYGTRRHSKLKELEYDDEDGSVDEVIFAQHTNDYDVRRQRFGFSATSDYRPSEDSRVYATGSYNVYLDDEVRRVAEYVIPDEEETRETRNRLEDQRVALLMAGGEHDLGRVRLEYRAAWIRSTEELPDRTYLRYQRVNPFTGFTNEQIKEFDGTTRFTGLDAPALNRLRYDDRLKEDEDRTGQLSLSVPFRLATGVSSLEVGGKLLRKDADYRAVRHQMTSFANGGDALSEGTFGFEDIRFDDPALGPLLTDWGAPRDITEDFQATEDISAIYAMTTLNVGPAFTALFGARLERTRTDYTQPNPETESAPLRDEGGYDNVVPSVHVTVRPDDRSNVRAAWWTGLARPRYWDLVPRRVVDDSERTIFYGNPDLEPRTAHSVDLMYERFTSGLGVVAIGAFYKRFQAFHTTRVFQEIVGGVPYEATQTIMGDGTASYLGLELSFNQRLGFLGRAARDVSLFGNYNYTWSEGEVDGRTLVLVNSPEHIANLSVLYDNVPLGLSLVLASNYRAAMLTDIGNAPYRDHYVDDEFHLDVSIVKAVTDRLTISTQLNGLMARQEREVLGDPGEPGSRLLQREDYGPYGTINLRYDFR